MKELILTSIFNNIEKLEFPRKSYYLKAKLLTKAVFSSFMNDDVGVDFSQPKQLPNTFFKNIVRRNEDRSFILLALKNAEILISDGKYFTGDEINSPFSMSYIINPVLIYNHNIAFTQFQGINKISDRIKYIEIKKNLEAVTIDQAVFDFIPVLVEQQLGTIKVGNGIKQNMIKMKLNGEIVSKHKSYWLKIASTKNVALINLRKEFYLESVPRFIERKRIELAIIYNYTVENIKNGNFYASRNITNNRLDHNLTGLKSELFQYIILDGEKTIEIDIKNAQFAMLANIQNFKTDQNFKINAQNGTLYKYIGTELEITEEEAKEYMMVASFGKVKQHPVKLKKLFPETMASISQFKNNNGYEQFSITLQKAESNLMIDGVFNMLTENGILCIPVHDSMRIKISDYHNAKKLILDFFDKKGFICEVKSK